MSERARLRTYLVLLHLVFAAAVAWLLRAQHPAWILAVEGVAAISLLLGWRTIERALRPLDSLHTGIDLLEARDLGSRLPVTGVAPVDELVALYNTIAADLREERVRLQEQEHFLSEVLDATSTGVILLDPDGRVTRMNPAAAEFLGTSPAAARGHRFGEVAVRLRPVIDGISAGGSEVITTAGRRRIRVHRGQFMDRGFPRTFYLLGEMTRELHESERAAYDRLIRTVSHEVNNTAGAVQSLLGSCRAYASQLGPEDQVDYERALDVATDRTARLNRFVRRFADVIRLPVPEREPVDLPAVVSRLERLLADELGLREIALDVLDGDRFPRVSVDADQFEQALLNILRNAMESIDRGGRIEVGFETEPVPTLHVRDDGPGIPADLVPRLFEPFWSSKPQGQGIGLTLVHEILAAHDLTFTLVNRPEQGAVFTIRFG